MRYDFKSRIVGGLWLYLYRTNPTTIWFSKGFSVREDLNQLSIMRAEIDCIYVYTYIKGKAWTFTANIETITAVVILCIEIVILLLLILSYA